MCAWLDVVVRTTVIDMQRARKSDLGEVMCERLESGHDVERDAEIHDELLSALSAIEHLSPELKGRCHVHHHCHRARPAERRLR